MKKNALSLLLFVSFLTASLLTGCTTYTTNTDLKFKSTQLYDQKPVIHVGEVKETADELILLGWVKASVTQPSYLSEDPTKEQANIVLAYKAKKLGADAVIFPEYKTLIAASLLNKIVAKGQAVKLKKRPDDRLSITSENISQREIEEITQLPPTSAPKKIDPFSIAEDLMNDPTLNTVPQPLISNVSIVTPELTTAEQLQQQRQQQTDTIDAYTLMLSNANFLNNKANELHEKEMSKSALRIIQYLEQFLAKAKLEAEELYKGVLDTGAFDKKGAASGAPTK